MSRLKKLRAGIPALFGAEPIQAKVKHQSNYGQTPWKPGEIPSMRNGSRIPVHGALDDKPQPYGEALAVQLPENRGDGYSPVKLVDVEGHETKRKQKSGEHGGSSKV